MVADHMALMHALGYEHRSPTRAHRLVQSMAASTPGAWLMARISPPLDRWTYRWSGGRWTLASALSGLPVIMLGTVGAKSGQRRSTPLIGIPVGGDLAAIGSGYGQAPTPGWVFNLRADPHCTVAYGGREVQAMAIEPEDPTEIWATARSLYPGYAKYPERVDRTIAVFVLSEREA